LTGDVELVEHLLFDAEATRAATTSWMKEEFSERRRVVYKTLLYIPCHLRPYSFQSFLSFFNVCALCCVCRHCYRPGQTSGSV